MNHDEKLTGSVVFGVFDGATSIVGVLAGLTAAAASTQAILAAAVGLAVAEAVGMACGDYLSGETKMHSAVMGAATAVGSVLPALAVALLPTTLGRVVAALVLITFGIGIAEVRPGNRLPSYVITFGTLSVATTLSAAAALLTTT